MPWLEVCPVSGPRSGDGRGRVVQTDAGQAVQPHHRDQRVDLGLRAAQQHDAPAMAQAPGQHRQVEHQGCVGKGQLTEVDDQVPGRAERTGECPAAQALGGPVLVAGTSQDGRILRELDDPGNLYNAADVDNRERGEAERSKLGSMVSIDEVTDALRDVIDPELGLDFVELGLIYEVDVNPDGAVKVTFTLTSPGCPIGPQVAEQIEEFVGDLDGVTAVESEMTFAPPWSPERMSDDAKFALGF
jgi:metal-sulfur cluster biosynthetic enzyme